jgi:ribosomal protein S18 acetylase RimI-like enzyme
MTYETFTMEHYAGALQLWQNCDGVGISDADAAPCIQLFLDRNPETSFCALDGPKVVGTILCGHDGRRGYLHHLAVSQQYRRRGIGSQLVNRSLARLEKLGIQKCHLFIFNANIQGQAFWEDQGWELRGDIAIMSKDLRAS